MAKKIVEINPDTGKPYLPGENPNIDWRLIFALSECALIDQARRGTGILSPIQEACIDEGWTTTEEVQEWLDRIGAELRYAYI